MTPKDIERFWSKVEKRGPDECWRWLAGLDYWGYGKFRGGTETLAHRYSWLLATGRNARQCVLHRCDNPACVNPAHLFEGTFADNSRDMVAKLRSTHGERHPDAKLTTRQVEAIVRMRRDGPSIKTIARRFGVSQSQIQRIVTGQHWRHLASVRAAREGGRS